MHVEFTDVAVIESNITAVQRLLNWHTREVNQVSIRVMHAIRIAASSNSILYHSIYVNKKSKQQTPRHKLLTCILRHVIGSPVSIRRVIPSDRIPSDRVNIRMR